jgi:hypothetical protein
MMKVNTSIHTLKLDSNYKVNGIFQESVIPYLETNRFRLRVRAIQQSHPLPYRAKILGRALLSARTNPNRFWMLLSGNAEVSLPSTTANLPTPARYGIESVEIFGWHEREAAAGSSRDKE